MNKIVTLFFVFTFQLFAAKEWLVLNDQCHLSLENKSMSSQGFCGSIHNLLTNFNETKDLTMKVEEYPFYQSSKDGDNFKKLEKKVKYLEKNKHYYFRVNDNYHDLNLIAIGNKIRIKDRLFLFQRYTINHIENKNNMKSYMIELSVFDKKIWNRKQKDIKFILDNYYKYNQKISFD